MTHILLTIAAIWFACGVLSYGLAYGYLQRECPSSAEFSRWGDRWAALFVALLGPVSLVIALLRWSKHGVKWI